MNTRNTHPAILPNTHARADYPPTAAECLSDSYKVKIGVRAAVRAFRDSRPWRGTLAERKAKFELLHEKLSAIYGITCALEFAALNGGPSGRSCYVPALRKITLRGKLSVITYLHEFAHALGGDEYAAVAFSLNLFRKHFPTHFAKLNFDGHFAGTR